jgi:hypothetical protein
MIFPGKSFQSPVVVQSRLQSAPVEGSGVSSRPRLGGEGRIRLPSWITVNRPSDDEWPGDVRGGFDDSDVNDPNADERHFTDPFERRADGLLLIESFVRLDLRRPRKAREWFLANGVPDLHWFDVEHELLPRGTSLHDEGREIWIEQHLIGQYMKVIERISRTLPPPAGQGAEWDEDWFPATDDVFGSVAEEAGTTQARILFEITMDSIATYLARAMSPVVDPLGAHGRPVRPTFPGAADLAVGPVVRYRWPSIIAPIYLQLYEALRRLSEGRPGARVCGECGEIFLVLDGRREKFCTNAEYGRNRERRYRERHRVTFPRITPAEVERYTASRSIAWSISS